MRQDDTSTDILNLDALLIPGMIRPVNGADGGVNYHMIHANGGGLLVQLLPYLNMAENDWVDVYWGDPGSPVASGLVLEEHLQDGFQLYIAASRIPEGIHSLYARVTRSGGGNGGETAPLDILVRTEFPGGIDPAPDIPGHQLLPPPRPELPPGGIIDEDAAKNGIKVTLDFYPNMRLADVITFSWGGVLLTYEVTATDMAAGYVERLVTEDTIRAAGDGDLGLTYRVRDEVHNPSSDWSPRTQVEVEIGDGLFDAPMVENPDPNADPYDVIDLDELRDDDLLVNVMVYNNGLLIGDMVTLTWVGTTAQGQPVTHTSEPRRVSSDPQVLTFLIPNADVRILGSGRGVASYTVVRNEVPAGGSRRKQVTFRGAESLLPPPELPDAGSGVLDPALASTAILIPGEALEADDTLFVTWHGTRANGTPLVHEFQRSISSGNAGKPVTIPVDGPSLIAPLNGGTLRVYYRLKKAGSGIELDSDRLQVSVGEARAELPAPSTRPPFVDGVLDPEQVGLELEIVVPRWPDMRGGQRVHLRWQAGNGQSHTDDVLINDSTAGRDVVFYLDRATLETYLEQNIELSYQVESEDEATQYSEVARFSVGTAQQGPLPLPMIDEAEGSVVNPDDVLQGATVVIDARADFRDYDVVLVRIMSAVSGGSTEIRHEINAGQGGKEVRVTVPWAVIDASAGTTLQVQYEVTRSADGSLEKSGTVTYSVVSDIGDGPLLIMGARFNSTSWHRWMPPRMLSALHRITLVPVLAEWRYEGETQWTQATRWIDDKPELRLYVRSGSETWECRKQNILGTGFSATGPAAFVAIRDEVSAPGGSVVDLKAWGDASYGGELDDRVSALDTVEAVATTGYAWAARLRDGTVHCWGLASAGGSPAIVPGQYEQVWAGLQTFVGRRPDGELLAWGAYPALNSIPAYVRQYKDYVAMQGAHTVMVALRKGGQVVAWGHAGQGAALPPHQDVIQIACNYAAAFAVRENANGRSVVGSGMAHYGGTVPGPIASLTTLDRIAATNHQAICVLLKNGSIRSWPEDNLNGGKMPQEIADLTNVLDVSATDVAFCAVLSTGKIVAWGNPAAGGSLTEEAAGLTNVVQVASNYHAFAALCSDGTVVAWGNPLSGGDTSSVADQLTGVVAIYSNGCAFAALTEDGRVVTWGVAASGGNSDAVQPEIKGKVTARRLLTPEESQVVAGGTGFGARR